MPYDAIRSATLIAIGVAVVTAAAAQSLAATVEVTTCGQIVPPKSRAVLVADLDCTGFNDNAIILGRRSRLDLQGFTLRGGRFGVRCLRACPGSGTLSCSARCRIDGSGGTITEVENTAITGEKMRVEDITITANGSRGIDSAGRAVIKDAVITNNGGSAVSAWGVSANRVIVTGNAAGLGASADRGVSVRNSTVTGNGMKDLASGRKPRVRNTTCDHSFRRGGGDWDVCTFDGP